ncbi:MAG: replicative DNA helicase [Firmicutes bacterium]|nr:replicative DNA helicase [Bacillota bacterium]
MSANESAPSAVEAEQAVLGAILLDPVVLSIAREIVSPEDFLHPPHRLIYEALLRLADTGAPIDMVTLVHELKQRNQLERVGGAHYLSELAMVVPSSAGVESYARIVEQAATLRRLVQAASEIAAEGVDGKVSVDKLVDEAEQKILAISQRHVGRPFVALRDVLVETFEYLGQRQQARGGITGLSTGFPDIDALTSGLQPADLIVVAARPSMGKTAFALNVCQHVALQEQQTVALFSLEMSRVSLATRLLCARGNVDSFALRVGQLDESEWQRLSAAVGDLSEAPLYVDDSPGLTVAEIRSKCRRLQAEHGLGLVVIDYLQLLGGGGTIENRQQEISSISRGLKALARELNVPVIALSQLSRAVEARQEKRPMLSDIRESGSIEQDADVVAFIYRDDYYNPQTDRPNIAEIIIAKQRNGPTGKAELIFLKQYNKFVSLEKTHLEG